MYTLIICVRSNIDYFILIYSDAMKRKKKRKKKKRDPTKVKFK